MTALKAHAIATLLVCPAVHSPFAGAQESSQFGYSSPQEALAALRSDPAASVRDDQGWTIVSTTSNGNLTLWSFTPEGHPAHPAGIKRVVVERNGTIYIDMSTRCGGPKQACDTLVKEFEVLNESISRNFQ